MTLTCRLLPGAVLITVTGQVDASNAEELETYIHDQRRRLDDNLVIEAGGLSFVDSSGLAVLLAAATLARVHGAGLHLAGVQPRVARILEITGAGQAMTLHDHVEQALSAVDGMPR